MRRLARSISDGLSLMWKWITDPFRDEEPLDVPVGLEDMHELAGGRLEEPR